MIRVLVVDDHHLVRAAVSALLSVAEGVTVVGECSDGAQVMATAASVQPDVVLMDLRMPVMSGLEVTRQLTVTAPDMKVLILTAMADAATMRALEKAGARGCLAKNCDAGTLVTGVRKVARGESVWSCR
ncbi:response regulator [Nakamurella sp. GG22]